MTIWSMLRGAVAGLFILAGAACATAQAPTKEIALTFDDAPLPPGPFLTGPERASNLVANLQRAGVREAAFFVNPGRPEPDRDARYGTYAAAGHVIANHTWDHPNLQDVTAEAYIANIRRADAVIRPWPGFKPWFRYPYLSEGDTVAKRDTVRQALVEMGYAQGYITADATDWRLDQLIQAASAAGKTIDRNALRDLYIAAAVAAADYNDHMARAVLGRAPRQVLLLHENDIEALYVADLVAALRRDGWRIITATEAFADPIASETPDTMQLSSGRIAALMYAHHAEAGFTEVRPWRLPELDAAFATRVLHEPAPPVAH